MYAIVGLFRIRILQIVILPPKLAQLKGITCWSIWDQGASWESMPSIQILTKFKMAAERKNWMQLCVMYRYFTDIVNCNASNNHLKTSILLLQLGFGPAIAELMFFMFFLFFKVFFIVFYFLVIFNSFFNLYHFILQIFLLLVQKQKIWYTMLALNTAAVYQALSGYLGHKNWHIRLTVISAFS